MKYCFVVVVCFYQFCYLSVYLCVCYRYLQNLASKWRTEKVSFLFFAHFFNNKKYGPLHLYLYKKKILKCTHMTPIHNLRKVMLEKVEIKEYLINSFLGGSECFFKSNWVKKKFVWVFIIKGTL